MSETSEGPRPPAGAAPPTARPPVTERHTEPASARAGNRAADGIADRAGDGLAGETADGIGGSGPAGRGADYRAVFRAATLPMAVVDHEGLILTANDALGALLGADPVALTAQSASDLLDVSSDGRTWHAYREVLRGRRSRFRCTRRLKHPDGRSLWAEITVAPMPQTPPGSSPVPVPYCSPSPTSATGASCRSGCATSRCTTR